LLKQRDTEERHRKRRDAEERHTKRGIQKRGIEMDMDK
jgi:hypothetical protein